MKPPNHSHPNKKKHKSHNPVSKFRSDLDKCTKNKDLTAAISLYEFALAHKIPLSQHHFNCLLYICSNSLADPTSKHAAIEHGLRIFSHMLANNTNPNEATITAVARLAVAKGDGDKAFELVKGMRKYNVLPKLRTYNPVLMCFCGGLEAEKAYLVEEEMLKARLRAEEAELAALLRVSMECGRGDKVYEYLHKIRGCLGCVSGPMAEAIENWFGREVVGEDLDEGLVREAVLRNGGGWHGLGWIGKGKWVVVRSNVGSDGRCCGCGEQLVCVDIDRVETEKFAQSVASLAMEREVQSNFTEFQNWLDERSDYEAIVDGANIGLFQQNFADGGFSISQLDAVVKELYNKNKKWPLIVLHNKRIRTLLESSSNRELLQEWMDQGLLYGTPFGSNDDWYWLYAAVKLRCLLVTNDEMRDHIFELLGSSFFLKWKERHQVRYTFAKANLKLQMPPSYSLVVQESVNGSWHVPLLGECSDGSSITWLCITRPGSCKAVDEVAVNEGPRSILVSSNHNFQDSCISGRITTENGSYGGCNYIPCCNNGIEAIRGKRKERSPSPSRPEPCPYQ